MLRSRRMPSIKLCVWWSFYISFDKDGSMRVLKKVVAMMALVSALSACVSTARKDQDPAQYPTNGGGHSHLGENSVDVEL